MSAEQQSNPGTLPVESEGRSRNILIFGALGVAAAIIFGLLYLFVIAPSAPAGSVGWFMFSFATGLTMIVMPCTLPLAFVIVPLAMGKSMIRGLTMALAFGLGVAVMLSTYGIIAALLGGFALDFLGNDIEPIKNWVYFIAGLFALTFAMSEIGLLNIHMPSYTGAAPAFIQKRGEYIKAFLLGLFLGNVGVGCPHPATPLILIEIATSGDVLYGWLLFLIHAIGRVLPLLLLAFLAVLGVNGLNWLMTRKDAVERATGWGMVFVAGFILTLGLFTHDWWVNSGIHSALESITQESYFNAWFNDALNTDVAHVHGLEEGVGLFGQPLWWGHWFLVSVWIIPIWWWWTKRRKQMTSSPAFALQELEKQIDSLERERRNIEATVNLDAKDTTIDLTALEAQMDALEQQRRASEKKAQYGEEGLYKNPLARTYEEKLHFQRRNYLLVISAFLILVFAIMLPNNFYYKSMSGMGHGDHGAADDGHDDHSHDDGPTVDTDGIHQMPDGSVMNGAGETLVGAVKLEDGSFKLADGTLVDAFGNLGPTHNGTPFTKSIAGLPEAEPLKFIELADGEEYDVTAEYVQKEVGNRMLRMMAYNRSIPGPFIKVQKDATIYINFTNNTDIDQTIHSHGLRLDNNFDGVPMVTQDVVKPGESFRYELYFKDEGMAWYHPHTRDDYGQEMGLYGVYLIDPLEGDYWNPVNREVPIVLDDILIENNEISTFYKDVIDHVLLGRFGNEFLVNGETNYELDVEAGETIRFQLTNVSNARTYRLSIPGVQMKIVGAEWGRNETEYYADEFLISASERVVFEAYFPEEGDYELINILPDRTEKIAEFEVEEAAGAVTSYAEAFNVLRTNEQEKEQFSQYRDEFLNRVPDKELLLTVNLTGQVDHSAHAHGQASTAENPMASLNTLQMEDPTNSDKINTTDNVTWILRDVTTGRESMDIPVSDWTFKQGDRVKIRLQNDGNADHVMQHPIHFHGQKFVVLSHNGVPNQNMVWKDVAMVPPGDYIDILLEMDILGEWMAHCHISEHLHGGMMLQYRVEDDTGYAIGDEYRASLPAGVGHHTQMAEELALTTQNTMLSGNTYQYSDSATDTQFTVVADKNFFQAGKLSDIRLSFANELGDDVGLDDTQADVLSIQFINSNNQTTFVTFPGNTHFPTPLPSVNSDDHGDGDGHDHSHSLHMIPVAHADGGTDHSHAVNEGARMYTVPVMFPERGTYKGFVEFIVPGESEPRVAVISVEVGAAGFNIDNFGWSNTKERIILSLLSILAMLPLVWWVRRYINKDNIIVESK